MKASPPLRRASYQKYSFWDQSSYLGKTLPPGTVSESGLTAGNIDTQYHSSSPKYLRCCCPVTSSAHLAKEVQHQIVLTPTHSHTPRGRACEYAYTQPIDLPKVSSYNIVSAPTAQQSSGVSGARRIQAQILQVPLSSYSPPCHT